MINVKNLGRCKYCGSLSFMKSLDEDGFCSDECRKEFKRYSKKYKFLKKYRK